MDKPHILLVDDEPNQLVTISRILERHGYVVSTANNGARAIEMLNREHVDVLVTDLNMPVMDGLELLQELAKRDTRPATVVLTGYGTIQSAVDAMKHGAADYLIKPCNPDELKLVIARQLELHALRREVAVLRRATKGQGRGSVLVGSSDVMQRVYELIESLARNKTTVLITGASGTGKELVARTLHERAPWSAGPFIAVNCGAVSENLLESQLFGHRRGAFTDAVEDQEGLFLAAHGGTLFLDEVSEIPLGLQVKFLRAIEEREVLRLGDTRPRKFDTRIIAATNRNLQEDVAEGRFREDLYYRLNVVEVTLPTLAERREDIDALADHFVQELARSYGVAAKDLSEEARRSLRNHSWPGNARELQNVIERAFALSDARRIEAEDIGPALRSASRSMDPSAPEPTAPPVEKLDDMERKMIVAALREAGGNKNAAARLLGIDRQRLYRRLAKYDIEPGGKPD